MITITYAYGRYEIRVDDQFYCTCDSWREVEEEVMEIGGILTGCACCCLG